MYEQIEMSRIPPPSVVLETGNKIKVLHKRIIIDYLQQVLPSLENLVVNDKQYVYAEKSWLKDVLHWVDEFVYTQIPELREGKRYPLGYTQTYMELLNSIANLSLRKHYDVDASVLLGIMVAESKKQWGNIPGDGKKRSYLVALTEDGGVVYDIYSKQMVSLKDFPNLQNVENMLF